MGAAEPASPSRQAASRARGCRRRPKASSSELQRCDIVTFRDDDSDLDAIYMELCGAALATPHHFLDIRKRPRRTLRKMTKRRLRRRRVKRKRVHSQGYNSCKTQLKGNTCMGIEDERASWRSFRTLTR